MASETPPTELTAFSHFCSLPASAPQAPKVLTQDEQALTDTEIAIALDAIAQLIPHLSLQDCLKLIELATAQAVLFDVFSDRQVLAASSTTAPLVAA